MGLEITKNLKINYQKNLIIQVHTMIIRLSCHRQIIGLGDPVPRAVFHWSFNCWPIIHSLEMELSVLRIVHLFI